MKERITPKDDIEIYNAFSNENTDKTDLLKWALCGKDYEDLEEQGLIVRLPCKVGDKFWYVNSYLDEPRIEEYQVKNFEICIYNILRIWVTETSCFIIDKNVCFSFAEAEKKLKELKGEE